VVTVIGVGPNVEGGIMGAAIGTPVIGGAVVGRTGSDLEGGWVDKLRDTSDSKKRLKSNSSYMAGSSCRCCMESVFKGSSLSVGSCCCPNCLFLRNRRIVFVVSSSFTSSAATCFKGSNISNNINFFIVYRWFCDIM
jgi:hypothetical protein